MQDTDVFQENDTGHAVAYESDNLYMLYIADLQRFGLVSSAQSGYLVYNTLTNSWSTWGYAANTSCAFIRPSEDKLYRFSNNQVQQEVKQRSFRHYVDQRNDITITANSGTSVTVSDASTLSVGDYLYQDYPDVPSREPGLSSITAINGNVLTMADSIDW